MTPPNSRMRIRDDGETLMQIAEATGIKYDTLLQRWNVGDRGEKLRRPVGKSGRRYGKKPSEPCR